MCRIILNHLNKKGDKQEITESYKDNSDGTGLYYGDYGENKSQVLKGAKGTKVDEIGNTLIKLRKNKKVGNLCLHFRFGTSGGIGPDQTHPIQMENDMYLMHNGVCQDFVGNEKFSDTQCMAYGLTQVLRRHNITKLSELVEDEMLFAYISHKFKYSKVVLIQHDKFIIFNEDLGEGKDGIGRSGKEVNYGCYNYDDIDNMCDYIIKYKTKSNGVESVEYIYYCGTEESALTRFGTRHTLDKENIEIISTEKLTLV